jgi:hypothetical protein
LRAPHLISPQCDFRPNERNRRIWEADENGACWAEFEVVRDELAALPKRARIPEIGPLTWAFADLFQQETRIGGKDAFQLPRE